MADEMLSPALSAAARAGHVVKGVRDEIVRASAAAEDAHETLLALREALAMETEKLGETTAHSVRMATELAGSLGRERREMGRLAQMLDAQATRVTDRSPSKPGWSPRPPSWRMTHCARPRPRCRPAPPTWPPRPARRASGRATAGEDLTRHIARLETAGVGVSEQVRAVEGGLSEQRTALIDARLGSEGRS